MRLGAIEAGGTKFRVAVFEDSTTEPIDEIRIETTSPDETIPPTIRFLGDAGVDAVGIAGFGPLDLDQASPEYGSWTATPKAGWSHVPFVAPLREALGVPVGIQTDVEGAGIAEYEQGAGQGCQTLCYVTVGTGLGAAVIVDGRPHGGHGHSEIGHIPVKRMPGDDFAGRCPFHGDCLEGMTSGPAIAERWGQPAEEMLDRPDVWDLEAAYLAQMVRTLVYTVAPHRVLFGGGVSQVPGLIDRIRSATLDQLGGYATSRALLENVASLVKPASLGQDAGLVGAAIIARRLV